MQLNAFSKGTRLDLVALRKPLRIMKAVIVMILVFCLNSSAKTFSQEITLSLNNASFETAIKEIQKQTDYKFVYTKAQMEMANKVSLEVKKEKLETVLQLCFEGQPLTYVIEENVIGISVKEKIIERKNSLTAIDITGQILNEQGEPIAGATILIKGTNKGTSSNENGEFVIPDVDENVTIIVSNVGYEKQEIKVQGRKTITVHLKLAISSLDETVIIAYGQTTTRLNTGTVTRVAGDDIYKQPVSNLLAALEGRVPGMMVTQTTGLPGSSIKVQIRGRTALDPMLTDDQPLFVIDGVPFAPNNGYLNVLRSALGLPSNSVGVSAPGGLSPFNTINVADIESVEVLRDADATAIYGSRGANGVVLITTKKGKAGKTVFNFNIQQGNSKPTHTTDLLSINEYFAMRHEAFRNDGIVPSQPDAYDFLLWDTTRYADFNKLLIGKTAQFTDIQGTISGGNQQTQFLLGANYHKETSLFPGSENDQRETIHFSSGHTTTNKKFGIQFSGSYSSDKNQLIASDLTSLINLPPNLKLYDAAGNLAWNEGGISNYDNPLAYLNQSYIAKTDNLISSLQLNYKPTKNISLRLNSGYNSVLLHENKTNPLSSQNPASNPVRSSSFVINSYKSWIAEPQAEYTSALLKGKINVLIGGTFQDQSNDISVLNGSGYINDALLGSLSGATDIRGEKHYSQYRYNAIFSRVNYNWKNRYILNLSSRRDGSSKFGPRKQFANFGSFGMGWIFTNEKFSKKLFSFLSYGKIRGSVGTTGNDKIANYQYLDSWNSTDNSYQNVPGLAPAKLFNPDYRWEKTTKIEGAIDLGFLKDHILFSAIFYRNRSSNQLVQYKLPTTTGFNNIINNLPALVQNSGIEFSLTSTNIQTTFFKWITNINFSVPKNKLISFPGLSSSSYSTQYVEGQPLNVIYLYKCTGVDPTTGLYTIEDVNKDGSFNVQDYQVSGTTDPNFLEVSRIVCVIKIYHWISFCNSRNKPVKIIWVIQPIRKGLFIMFQGNH